MTLNSNSTPRPFSWRRPLIVNAWLALTFLIAAGWNIAIAVRAPYLQLDLLALTIGFIATYVIGFHRQEAVAFRHWLFLSVIALAAGAIYAGIKYALIGV